MRQKLQTERAKAGRKEYTLAVHTQQKTLSSYVNLVDVNLLDVLQLVLHKSVEMLMWPIP